jgi:hypothetical protein
MRPVLAKDGDYTRTPLRQLQQAGPKGTLVRLSPQRHHHFTPKPYQPALQHDHNPHYLSVLSSHHCGPVRGHSAGDVTHTTSAHSIAGDNPASIQQASTGFLLRDTELIMISLWACTRQKPIQQLAVQPNHVLVLFFGPSDGCGPAIGSNTSMPPPPHKPVP